MTRHVSIRIRSSIRCMAAQLISAVVLLNSVSAVAQDPIPFKAMMHSAGAPSAVPPKPASDQQANQGPITKTGKAEIGVGFLLVGVGITAVSITAALNHSGFNPAVDKSTALYAAGGGAMAVGVTLIALGLHRHKRR